MKDTTHNNLAFALFCLCVLAAMFWPERGRAQTEILGTMNAVPDARAQITKSDKGDITASPTSYWEIDTFALPEIKKDTILGDCLCILVGETPIARESVVISEPWHEQKQFGFVPYVTQKRQERTLEWGTWPVQPTPDKNGLSYPINITKSGWLPTKTHWLDPIDGCYQLVKLKND